MADDVFANIAAFYEQQRIFEEQHGPRITEIRGCEETLIYLVSILGKPAVWTLGGPAPMASLNAFPLVRDDGLPRDIVRLVHADGSKRDIVVCPPIPLLPEGNVDG